MSEQSARPESEPSRGAGIVKNTAIVTAFLLIGKVLGLCREMIMSRFIGAGAAADVYRFITERIIVDLYTKFEKLLQPTYMPLVVARRQHDGEEAGWRFTNVMGTLHFLVLLVFAVAGAIGAPWLFDFFGSGTGHQQVRGVAIALLRIAFPMLVVYSVSNLVELTVQSYNQFTLPALAEATRRTALVVGLLAAVVVLKKPEKIQAVQGLVYGLYVGITLRLLIQLPALRGKWRHWRPSLDLRNPDLRRALVLMAPLLIGVALALTRNLVETKFAFNFGEGNLAALGFARKLIDMPWQMLGLALSQVIYPFISELAAGEQHEDMANALVSTVRVLAYVFLPITVWMFVLATPVTRVAYEGGVFKAASVDLTAQAFIYYVPGLIFFAVEDPMLKWFYALKNTVIPVVLGFLSDVLAVSVMVIGVYVFHAQLPALALSLVVSKAVKVCIAAVILSVKLGGLPRHRIVPFIGQMFLLLAVFLAIIGGGRVLLHSWLTASYLKTAAAMAIISAAGVAGYVVVSIALKLEEYQMVAGFVRKRLRR